MEKLYYKISDDFGFHYLKYTPDNYVNGEKIPLVVLMHGAGERGNPDGSELDLVKKLGFLKHVDSGEKYPFMIVAPQCPNTDYWVNLVEYFDGFLDEVLRLNDNVDLSRVYLTGLSMGATATWLWAYRSAERFAAICPVCGEGISWIGGRLIKIPTMIFHGDCDSVISPHHSLSMATKINNNGGNAQLVFFAGVGHNAWDYTYDESLVNWFLSHKNDNLK